MSEKFYFKKTSSYTFAINANYNEKIKTTGANDR